MTSHGMRSLIVVLTLLLTVVQGCSDASTNAEDEKELRIITDPFEANDLLSKGVNLGNALEAPREGDWGLTLEAGYFELIKDAGFTAVRVPVRWSAHAHIDSPYTIDGFFMNRIDWVVEQARINDLAVVINIHHYEEIFEEPTRHKKRFLAMWRQIAGHFKNADPELIFEVLNEPHDNLTAELWNVFLKDAINVIRESNPYRTLMVGTADWGGVGSLEKLELPEEERNLIISVHYYEPFQFTHQGAEWVDGSDAWLGTKWTNLSSEKQAVDDDFNLVMSWANNNDRPVNIGEFGSYSRADIDSRYRWTKYVRQVCENRGFSWIYWEFGAGFGLYDRESCSWRSRLLDALME